MSVLDIILVSLGAVAVILYLIYQITKYKKDKKAHENKVVYELKDDEE